MCIWMELTAELKAEAISTTHRWWNLTFRQQNYHVHHSKNDSHVGWPYDVCIISGTGCHIFYKVCQLARATVTKPMIRGAQTKRAYFPWFWGRRVWGPEVISPAALLLGTLCLLCGLTVMVDWGSPHQLIWITLFKNTFKTLYPSMVLFWGAGIEGFNMNLVEKTQVSP